MQKKQATGIDTKMMLPVYAAIYSILCQFIFPWISIPALKYSKLPFTYTIFHMKECIYNIQHFASNGYVDLRKINISQSAVFTEAFSWIEAGAVLLIAALFAAVILLFLKREKSQKYLKVVFVFNFIYTWILFFVVMAGNMFINQELGLENDFMNLSIHSHIQLTSWVYAQMIISFVMIIMVRKLIDVKREQMPQTYIERTFKEDKKIGKRTKAALLLILFAIPFVIFFGIFFLNDRSSVFIGLCIICLSMLPFAMVFEERKPQAREILLIAVMAGIAVVGRMAFFMVPQFKPVTAVVIITGIGLGAEAGFLTGAVAGFVSNFFFGQGPWTPWQMFAFGIIGFLAGLIFRKKRNKKGKAQTVKICIFGGIATFLIYGVIMDIASVLNISKDVTWELLAASMISGIPFNMIHGISTVIFLAVLAQPFEKKLERIKKKYGILEI